MKSGFPKTMSDRFLIQLSFLIYIVSRKWPKCFAFFVIKKGDFPCNYGSFYLLQASPSPVRRGLVSCTSSFTLAAVPEGREHEPYTFPSLSCAHTNTTGCSLSFPLGEKMKSSPVVPPGQWLYSGGSGNISKLGF